MDVALARTSNRFRLSSAVSFLASPRGFFFLSQGKGISWCGVILQHLIFPV